MSGEGPVENKAFRMGLEISYVGSKVQTGPSSFTLSVHCARKWTSPSPFHPVAEGCATCEECLPRPCNAELVGESRQAQGGVPWEAGYSWQPAWGTQ